MADAADLNFFEHTGEGNAGVNGVKVGEPLTVNKADGNAELRLAPVKDRARAKCRDETAPS
jgi:hypothetical protein